MCCPNKSVWRYGFYRTKTRGLFRRYRCSGCRRSWSARREKVSYHSKIPRLISTIRRLLAGGMSEREIARILRINRKTVARYVKRFGYASRCENLKRLDRLDSASDIVFDDMETFEHTKCKPLSITVAVVEKTREIICAEVSQMPAKGLLAAISRAKYGPRDDHRKAALSRMVGQIKRTKIAVSKLKSDQCPRYPKVIENAFPGVQHETFLSRRACVVGQGELKKSGNDPLFYLNHNCAMIRDRIKRLSRRTWCTTKDPRRLQNLLDLYIRSHNERLANLRPSKGWNHTI